MSYYPYDNQEDYDSAVRRWKAVYGLTDIEIPSDATLRERLRAIEKHEKRYMAVPMTISVDSSCLPDTPIVIEHPHEST